LKRVFSCCTGAGSSSSTGAGAAGAAAANPPIGMSGMFSRVCR
jgi:hypothetical protein